MLLTPAYPEVAPRCTIRPAGTSIDSQNFDQALKDIEVEVNAYYDEIVTDEPHPEAQGVASASPDDRESGGSLLLGMTSNARGIN